jgi:hypothetical protein
VISPSPQAAYPYIAKIYQEAVPTIVCLFLMTVACTWLLLHAASQWARTRTEVRACRKVMNTYHGAIVALHVEEMPSCHGQRRWQPPTTAAVCVGGTRELRWCCSYIPVHALHTPHGRSVMRHLQYTGLCTASHVTPQAHMHQYPFVMQLL